jgi:acetyltransferase-like isoleucine patch superfamily enzyme
VAPGERAGLSLGNHWLGARDHAPGGGGSGADVGAAPGAAGVLVGVGVLVGRGVLVGDGVLVGRGVLVGGTGVFVG